MGQADFGAAIEASKVRQVIDDRHLIFAAVSHQHILEADVVEYIPVVVGHGYQFDSRCRRDSRVGTAYRTAIDIVDPVERVEKMSIGNSINALVDGQGSSCPAGAGREGARPSSHPL